MSYLDMLESVAKEDVRQLKYKDEQYGGSWKQRGGIGAFMMMARKWDRIENQVKKVGYDIFAAMAASPGPDGFADDVGDLRRYAMLIEAEMMDRRVVENEEHNE